MILEIHNGIHQLILSIPLDVSWTAKSQGQFGSASFYIARNTPYWGSPAIRPDGGSLIRISDGEHAWVGIADEPRWEEAGARIDVLEIGKWLEKRRLTRKRTFLSCTADIIARRAIQDAFHGSAVLPVRVGACAVGPPVIHRYEFTGLQSVSQVLADLQGETGQEWEIDPHTYEFRWQMQTGRYREGLLVDQGDLFPDLKIGNLGERYQQTTEVDSRTKRSFTAWSMTTPPLWPAQTSLEV